VPLAAKQLLERLLEAFHQHIGEMILISNAELAELAGLSESTVSRITPELAAWPDCRNTIPFIVRGWIPDMRRYYLIILPAPETRGWLETPPIAPAPEGSIADGDAALEGSIADGDAALEGSIADGEQMAIQPITEPNPTAAEGSIADPSTMIKNNNKLASEPSNFADPREAIVRHLTSRGIYAGLAHKVLQAQPDLTIAGFDQAVQVLAERGCYARPAIVAATILAKGQAVEAAVPLETASLPNHADESADFMRIAGAPLSSAVRSRWIQRYNAAAPEERSSIVRLFLQENSLESLEGA